MVRWDIAVLAQSSMELFRNHLLWTFGLFPREKGGVISFESIESFNLFLIQFILSYSILALYILLRKMLFNYHSSPAWSFGGKPTLRNREEAPAPNTYFEGTKLKRTSPGWKIGTSTRGNLSFVQPKNPGPGSYQAIRRSNAGIKFNKSLRTTQVQDENPGPGTYTLDASKKLKRGYYMSKKHKDMSDKQNPGPGAYETAFKSSLRKSFGRMNSAKKLVYHVSDVPGPGAYFERAQSAGPRISFSRQKRMKPKIHNNQIGPGKYEADERFNTDPTKGYSISSKFQDVPKQETPGPSTYFPKDTTKSHHRSVLIAERFESGNRPKTPGPGEYAYEKQISFISDIKHGVLAKEKRKPLTKPPETPGPGGYTIGLKSNSPTSPKYTIVANHSMVSNHKNPGPGDYCPSYQPTRVRPSSVKIGSSVRKDPKIQMKPGPGQYNRKGMPEGPSWGFGSQVRESMCLSETPGSNHYNLRSTIADVPSYILSNPN